MEPKTDLQRLVVEVSSKLPKITDEQEKYGFDKCLPHFAVFTKSGIYSCLDCGHRWHNDFDMRLIGVQCPACKRELDIKVTRDRVFKAQSYYTVISAFKGFQIIRVCMVYGRYKVGKPCEQWLIELYRFFVNDKGQSEVVGLYETSRYYECWGGSFELRSKEASSDYYIYTKVINTESRVIPALRRNGFKGSLHNVSPQTVFVELLSNPVFETLWKAKYYNVLKFFESSSDNRADVENYFGVLKICIRNNYNISDATMYFDYLNLLQFSGKDLRNVKYVCPEDLKARHDKLVDKKRRMDELKRIEEQKKKAKVDQKKYAKSKGVYFGICFIQEDLCVKVIESVEEVIQEAEAHKHCVFVNRYFDKKDSLLMSARLNGKLVETVEFSLKKMQVIQARGFQNRASEYHDQVIALVNNNLNVIRKCYQKTLKTA